MPPPRRRTPPPPRPCWRRWCGRLRDYLGNVVYGVDVPSLEAVCMAHLKARGLTFATAESCTGGQVAARITALPGASAVYRGGVAELLDSGQGGGAGRPLGVAGGVRRRVGAMRPLHGGGRPPDHRRGHRGFPSPVWRGRIADERGNPVGLVYCGAVGAGGHLLPEAGTGKPPPRPHSGPCRQPRLRYAAALPYPSAGGKVRPRQASGTHGIVKNFRKHPASGTSS